jgi:hypothetical protein
MTLLFDCILLMIEVAKKDYSSIQQKHGGNQGYALVRLCVILIDGRDSQEKRTGALNESVVAIKVKLLFDYRYDMI